MDASKAKLQISLLSSELIGHNYNYYVLDKPTITDQEFDARLRTLKELEAQFPQFILKDSPTQTVGHPVVAGHFALMKHRFEMLSLDNSLTVDELIDWTTDISEDTPIGAEKTHEVRIEWKMDGLSLDLIYFKGRLMVAITRGDGIRGENVTLNALQIPSIPKTLPLTYGQDWFSIRGEVVANLAHYRKLNAQLIEAGKQPYANPRNYAAGALRQKDPAVTAERGLEFYCYSVTAEPEWPDNSWFKEQEFMKLNGFLSADTGEKFHFNALSGQHTTIPETVNKLQSLRSQLPFEVDGLVVKVIDHDIRKALGFTSKFPRWATAYKFPAAEGETDLLDVEYQVGRTGRCTPVARIAPVLVHGTTISNVTLHNRSQIERLQLYMGCRVIVKRAGDVIPQIVGTTVPRPDGARGYDPITHCPSCDEPTSIVVGLSGESDYCNNKRCEGRRLAHMIYCASRGVFNIKGLGDEYIKALLDKNLINPNLPLDMLDLNRLNFEAVGLSDKMAIKLEEAVKTARASLTLPRALMSFNIDGVASSTAEDIARHFQSFENIAKASIEDLMKVDGVGETTAQSVWEFFDEDNSKHDITSVWRGDERNLNLPAPQAVAQTEWTGQSVVVTGSKFAGKTRKEIEQTYKQMGATIASNVSSKTKLVLCGTKYTARKLEEAKANNVPYIVYSEDGIVEDCSVLKS